MASSKLHHRKCQYVCFAAKWLWFCLNICSKWTVEDVFSWINVQICGHFTQFRILVVAVSCYNSQSESLILAILKVIYNGCSFFVSWSWSHSRKNVADSLGCISWVQNILITVMTHTVIQKRAHTTLNHNQSVNCKINVLTVYNNNCSNGGVEEKMSPWINIKQAN